MINHIFGINKNNPDSYNRPLRGENWPNISKIDNQPLINFTNNSEYGKDNVWLSEIDGQTLKYINPNNKTDSIFQKNQETLKQEPDQLWSYFENCAKLLGIDNNKIEETKNITNSINNAYHNPKTKGNIFSIDA